ncbi:MAG TPA: alpha/beta hydrolase [Candidatus Hydrogenedentes bacterium]|nr:alpha/beta hydrolase [Candidatus Hydrogenedentota bacterium]
MKNLWLGRLLTVATLALAGCPATPTTFVKIPDIRYATTPGVEANLQSLDIYLPDPAPANPMPVVIWVHGGAWKGGDKANKMQYKPSLFTGVGYCFVSVNYRLSPDSFAMDNPARVMHPIHVQDVAAAIAWVYTHIASYGGDPTRMALLGHSAGGHLVSLVSTDESFLAAHGLPLTVIKGTAELDAEGLDIVAKMRYDPGNEMILNAFGDEPLVWEAASPINHLAAGKGIPPFLVAKRGNAFRQGIADDFAAGVQAAGSSVTIVDASVYTHEEVNENIGAPGESVITPPVMTFFADIFGGTGPIASSF